MLQQLLSGTLQPHSRGICEQAAPPSGSIGARSPVAGTRIIVRNKE